MILYLDTTVLVAALTREAETERVLRWLGGREAGRVAVSDWVATEFSSALSIKLRAGQIEAERRADALAMFNSMREENFVSLAISDVQFRTAARFADQHALGLPAGEALHLAVCADHGATLCTLDRRLGGVGPRLGVKTLLV